MKLLRFTSLALAACISLGCAPKMGPPPAMTDDVKAKIKEDDAKIQAAESQQGQQAQQPSK